MASNLVYMFASKHSLVYKRLSHLLVSFQARTSSAIANRKDPEYDVAIVGGGIVGLATAQELIIRHPQLSIAVLEKEPKLGVHQSGHNSGVIHAGIYYQPGSMKAKLCVEGMQHLYAYCDQHSIPYKKCGKLIVAVTPEETKHIQGLLKRGQENGVQDLKYVPRDEIKQYAPYCKGLQAIWSPHTGIIDYQKVCQEFGNQFQKRGGAIYLNFQVKRFGSAHESQKTSSSGLSHTIRIQGSNKVVRARYVVTAGGLFSDKLAEIGGCSPEPKILPFRGEYLVLKPSKSYLAQTNIYPVPNPGLPFLGVHFTPRMDGSVWLGPNAVLAFKREGYHVTDFSLSDMQEFTSYPGLRKLAFKHLGYGLQEMYRGLNISAQVQQLKRYVPQLTLADVQRGPAGVRAQALDRQGNLIDDFVFDLGMSSRILHVRNAPSPAATSSLAIARVVVDKIQETFQL